MKRFFLFALCAVALSVATPTYASVAENTSGRILLQVEENGEAWYIYPSDLNRYYLGRPDDAFDIMRELGLGITSADLAKIPTDGVSWDGEAGLMSRVKGYILLDVEQNGEAWYVDPSNGKRYYLDRPDDAFEIMRERGVGATTADIYTISESTTSIDASTDVDSTIATLEADVFDLINDYRAEQGLSRLSRNSTIDTIAREHSENMADGTTAFGHDGFSDRYAQILASISGVYAGAENVAYATDRDSLAEFIANGWIASEGHRANIERSIYTISGMGVAFGNNRYYFTQLFAAK